MTETNIMAFYDSSDRLNDGTRRSSQILQPGSLANWKSDVLLKLFYLNLVLRYSGESLIFYKKFAFFKKTGKKTDLLNRDSTSKRVQVFGLAL